MNHPFSKPSRNVVLAGLLLAAMSLTGCTMCCGPYDYDYSVFGGKFQRADPAHGRVGSIFSDPYLTSTGPSADSNLKPHPTDERSRNEPLPNPYDELDDANTASRTWRGRTSNRTGNLR